MRVLIYSDVHGNLPAFETVLKDAGPCDMYICLGDLVNYGPWSNECVDLALSLPHSIILSGNHEEAFLAGSYPGENNLVLQFFDLCIKDFHRSNEISRFTSEYRLDKFICKHTVFDQYIYPDTTVLLDSNYFIGHSHHQFHYKNNGFDLYNSGSVGQNRKIIDVANYILFDLSDHKIEMKSVVYPLDVVIQEMKHKNYPVECLDYYLNKTRHA